MQAFAVAPLPFFFTFALYELLRINYRMCEHLCFIMYGNKYMRLIKGARPCHAHYFWRVAMDYFSETTGAIALKQTLN